jgi:hypothetical protein
MHTQVVKIIIFTVHSYKSPFCWCHLSQLQSSSPIHMLLFNDTVTVVSLEILLLWLPSCPWSLVPRSTKTSIWPLYFGGVNHALKTMASEHRTTLTDAAEPGVGGWRCWMVEAHYTAIAILLKLMKTMNYLNKWPICYFFFIRRQWPSQQCHYIRMLFPCPSYNSMYPPMERTIVDGCTIFILNSSPNYLKWSF